MNNSFTVIIPLYNKEPYIKRALETVLNQTYDNFEMIIIDDGSTDEGVRIVSSIQDTRIKVFSQINSGVSAARNRGALLAKNQYLAFLDADDTWEPNFLQEISNLIDEFPYAGIYATNNKFIYPSGKVMLESFSDLFNGKNTGIIEDYFGLFAKIQKSPFSNSNLCIPKKIYDEFGGYKEGVKLTEDSDLWCRIALKYDVAFSVKPLANYFVALEGSTHTIFENKDFEVVNTLQSALVNKNVPQRLEKSVKKLIALQKLGLIKRGILTSNKGKILKNFLNFSVIKHYPVEYAKCFLALLIPYFFIKRK
jgi:glycosyltransferase involved in cell wall biosynthesis